MLERQLRPRCCKSRCFYESTKFISQYSTKLQKSRKQTKDIKEGRSTVDDESINDRMHREAKEFQIKHRFVYKDWAKDKSIILQEKNPVTKDYVTSRQQMTQSLFHPTGKTTKFDVLKPFDHDPYVQMLTSPLRSDYLTRSTFPRDFLVRLGFVKDDTKKPSEIFIIPSGVTPNEPRKPGAGSYVLCNAPVMFEYPDMFSHHLSIKETVTRPVFLELSIEKKLRQAALEHIEILYQSKYGIQDGDQVNYTEEYKDLVNNAKDFCIKRIPLKTWNKAIEQNQLPHEYGAPTFIVHFSTRQDNGAKFGTFIETFDDANLHYDKSWLPSLSIPIYNLSNLIIGLNPGREGFDIVEKATHGRAKLIMEHESLVKPLFEFDQVRPVFAKFDKYLDALSSEEGKEEKREQEQEETETETDITQNVKHVWAFYGPSVAELFKSLYRWRLWIGEASSHAL